MTKLNNANALGYEENVINLQITNEFNHMIFVFEYECLIIEKEYTAM